VTDQEGLSCCIVAGETILIGTDEPSLLRVNAKTNSVEKIQSFDLVPGRETWYAGSAIIDGKRVGPPLGVRSLASSSDGVAWLVNVHVGGVPLSIDSGQNWQPTIYIDADVHEVRAHPNRPNVVAAAAAVGLCMSMDGGGTWRIEAEGLHAPHCSAVAFVGNDVLVSASESPFSPEGAIYRRPIDERRTLALVQGGLPRWLSGKVDTHCIAVNGPAIAIADMGGNLYTSVDQGHTWLLQAEGLPQPSSVLIL
jgi:hypothetical protein